MNTEDPIPIAEFGDSPGDQAQREKVEDRIEMLTRRLDNYLDNYVESRNRTVWNVQDRSLHSF